MAKESTHLLDNVNRPQRPMSASKHQRLHLGGKVAIPWTTRSLTGVRGTAFNPPSKGVELDRMLSCEFLEVATLGSILMDTLESVGRGLSFFYR